MQLTRISSWLLAILLLGSFQLQAGDVAASSCSSADVNTAIGTAVDGDTVIVPSGSCTWSAQVLIPNTKGVSLQGAGIGSTIITDNLTTDDILQLDVAGGNAVVDISGFTFDANSIIKTGSRAVIAFTGSGLDRFRIHDIKIINIRSNGISWDGNGSEISGLIDNCTMEDAGDFSGHAFNLVGDAPGGARGQFAHGFNPGTNKAIYIEDCLIDFTFKNDGAVDAFSGARYVFRHNTVNNTLVSHHGADSGNRSGTYSMEVYDNTFDSDFAQARAFFFRSGSGVVYNNTLTGSYTALTVFSIANFRSRPEVFNPWGQCDGSSVWDENVGGESGWACLDQIGHIFGVSSGGSNTLEGLYGWTNVLNGSDINIKVSETSMENHLQENRDFFDEDASFDGTSGVGVGTIASRPATCTVQVGFFATDEGDNGKLYRCLTTDTWTFYYESFTYPHPLRAGEDVKDKLQQGIGVTIRSP